MVTLPKSEDPDELPSTVAFNQGLQCLYFRDRNTKQNENQNRRPLNMTREALGPGSLN